MKTLIKNSVPETTSAFDTLSKNISLPDPIGFVKSAWASQRTLSDLKVLFADRNEDRVIIPFLDGIGAKYVVIGQTVLIRYTDAVQTQLAALGFVSTYDVLPHIPHFKRVLGTTDDLQAAKRSYNKEYNIELHLIASNFWNVAVSADILTKALVNKPDGCLSTYLKLYTSLISQLIGEQK